MTANARIIPISAAPRPLPVLADDPVAPLDGVLLDRRQRRVRDLRISVTDRCNFRCVYCMPKEVFDLSLIHISEPTRPY